MCFNPILCSFKKCFICRQMKSPAITATMYGGNKTLYLQVIWTYIIVLDNLFKFTDFERKSFDFFSADSSFHWRANKAKSFQDTKRYHAVVSCRFSRCCSIQSRSASSLCRASFALFCTVQQNVLHDPPMCNTPFSAMSFELLKVMGRCREKHRCKASW